MKLIPVLAFILVFGSTKYAVNSLSLQFGDLTKSSMDLGKGLIDKVPDVIPSPNALFQMGKNVIAGYPFDIASRAINTFCSAALSVDQVKPKFTPDIQNMSFILKADNKDYFIPLTQPHDLWIHEKFNPDWPLVIVITGWSTNYNNSENSALDTLYKAYHCRGNFNFVGVDSAAFVDTLYSWSAFNTDAIGVKIGEALADLVKSYPLEKIHLIGHSLGAHIAGSAGRNLFFKTEKLVPRITGLDPASPCFNEGESLSGLFRGDAEFVDIIHTNVGVLGKRDSIGDADYYPNGLMALPPGCLSIVCAHCRAWEFYAESVYPGNEEIFMATKCTSITAMNMNLCPGPKNPMGFAVNKRVKGNLFLVTNGNSPFGKNHKGSESFQCNSLNENQSS